jgi:hypothetical protein
MIKYLVLPISLALFALLASCEPPLGSSAKASIVVRFGAGARTVMPQANLGITSIAVTVTHPGGSASGSAASVSETCTIGDIVPGSATINAVASNGANTVASGSAPLDVVLGANVITINLVPESGGTGSFALAMSWPESTGASFVECSLRDSFDTEVDAKSTPVLTPSVGKYSWTYQGSANSGVYTLFITFRTASGGTVLGAFIESVNIFKNLESNSWLDGGGIPRALRDFSVAELKDSLATLSKLVVTGAGLSNAYSPPALAPGATIAMGKTSTHSISFAPTLVADTGQTISYTWNGGAATTISSGSSAGPLSLVDGAAGNTLVITVSTSSSQTATYTVTIIKAYVLSYDGNGAVTGRVPADELHFVGQPVTTVDNLYGLSIADFSFAGWNTAADGSGDAHAAGTGFAMYSQDTTLYAQWAANPGGRVWTEREVSGGEGVSWGSVACSSDGMKLVACVYNGYVFTSVDGGVTWTERTEAGYRTWMAVASSSDGTKLVACVGGNGGFIYTSDDSGATWTERTGAGSWSWGAVASSSDGTKLAVCAGSNGGYIYTSVDGGATWTQRTTAGNKWWSVIASSSDGSRLVAGIGKVTDTPDYLYTSGDGGATWTQQTGCGSGRWVAVTSSADGTRLAACAFPGYIYTSINGGVTWIQRTTPNTYWVGITSSSDGMKLTSGVGGSFDGPLYTSTDGGATWNSRPAAGSHNWGQIACSSDGSKLVVGCPQSSIDANSGMFYTSADSGATWTAQTGSRVGGRYWYGIAGSSDWTRLAAASYFGSIYTSADGGQTWTKQAAAGNRSWFGVSSSSDGMKLAACIWSGYIYTSADAGATWTERAIAGSRLWYTIGSSSDGMKLATCVQNDFIYTSIDGGANWIQQTAAGNRTWQGIASSSDGTKLAACVYGSYIYTSADSGATWNPSGSPAGNWKGIASSSDGSRLVARQDNSAYLYVSSNSGATWTTCTAAGSRQWRAIACSADGTKLAAGAWGDYLYTSADGGVTWAAQTGPGIRNWNAIASSPDATKIAAAAYGSRNIWTSP